MQDCHDFPYACIVRACLGYGQTSFLIGLASAVVRFAQHEFSGFLFGAAFGVTIQVLLWWK